MDWKKIKHIENNNYEIPGDSLLPHYFEALDILFRIENTLRLVVYFVLKSNFSGKWLDINITSDDQDSTTIGAIAKKRINQDNNFGYLGYPSSSPLLYLTSGELIRIITSDSYWKYFKSLFPGSREIMRNKLDEIGNIRNSFAHFRALSTGDVDLIRQNAIHTLSKIEKSIYGLLNCNDIVPSNSDDSWYKELSTIGSQHTNLKFTQSIDESWVSINLIFNPPILKKVEYYKGHTKFKTIRLNAANILLKSKKLRNIIVCATESVKYFFSKEEISEFNKAICFHVTKDILETQHSHIKEELVSLISEVENEIELITSDNMARGSLISLVGIEGSLSDSGYWSYELNHLKTPTQENDPVEFWSSTGYSDGNFVSNSNRFPWINVNISEDNDLPF